MCLGNKWYGFDTLLLIKYIFKKKLELFFIFSIMIIIYEKIINKLDLNEKNGINYFFFIEAKIILHRFI